MNEEWLPMSENIASNIIKIFKIGTFIKYNKFESINKLNKIANFNNLIYIYIKFTVCHQYMVKPIELKLNTVMTHIFPCAPVKF